MLSIMISTIESIYLQVILIAWNRILVFMTETLPKFFTTLCTLLETHSHLKGHSGKTRKTRSTTDALGINFALPIRFKPEGDDWSVHHAAMAAAAPALALCASSRLDDDRDSGYFSHTETGGMDHDDDFPDDEDVVQAVQEDQWTGWVVPVSTRQSVYQQTLEALGSVLD